jgi:streptogramin lyase
MRRLMSYCGVALQRRGLHVTLPLLGVLVVFGVGVAGAAPLGQITEFAAPGSNIAQVRAGSDGNLWFTDRAGAIGQITTSGVITRFTSGLIAGSQPFSLAVGADGNVWFTDAPVPVATRVRRSRLTSTLPFSRRPLFG